MILILFIILIFTTIVALNEPIGKLHANHIFTYRLIIFILLIYFIFRDGTAFVDYGSYEWALKENINLGEPSFMLIVWFVKKFFRSEVVVLFAIYGTISLSIKGIAIAKLTTLPFFSLMIFCSDFYILQELTQMRASLATGILLISIPSLYRREAKRYFSLSFFATLMHFSGLLMLPLWFINGNRINLKSWLIVYVGCYIAALIGLDLVNLASFIPIPSIQSKFIAYRTLQSLGNGTYQANIFSLLFLAKSAITLILLFKYKLILNNCIYGILLLKIMLISLCCLLLFSQNMAAGLRISEFYGTVSIILFPMIYFILKSKIVAKTIIVIVTFSLFYIRVYSQKLILF